MSQIAHASIFSDLNKLRVNPFLSSSDEKYFGFYEKEVKALFSYYGCDVNMRKAQDWHGGYLFHEKQVYNPCSILSFIDVGCVYDAH